MNENRKCPNCGGELPAGALYCFHCMSLLEQKETIKKPREIHPKKTRNIITCVVLAVVIIASSFAGVMLLNRGEDEGKKTESKTVAVICTPKDFLSRVDVASAKLELDDLWNVESFREIRASSEEDIVEYTADLNIDASTLSLFFHSGGEEISSVIWDVGEDDLDKAKMLLICLADSICGNYYTDINDVFFDADMYPRSTLEKPYEDYFTDLKRRTEKYEEFLSSGGEITTEYVGMRDSEGNDIYILLYVTCRTDGENTLYDLTLYIENYKA